MAILTPTPRDTPSVILSERSISDHAAIQWCRRVRVDPDILAWAPREHVGNRLEGIPAELLQIVRRARDDMLDVLTCATLHFEAPAWYGTNLGRASTSAYLMLGDDHAVVLRSPDDRRLCPADGWTAVTTIVRRGPDSPETLARVEARRARIARSRVYYRPGEHLPLDDGPETRPHAWLRKTYCWH